MYVQRSRALILCEDNPLCASYSSPVQLVELLLHSVLRLCSDSNGDGAGVSGGTSMGSQGGSQSGRRDEATDLEEMSLEDQGHWMDFMDGLALLQVTDPIRNVFEETVFLFSL